MELFPKQLQNKTLYSSSAEGIDSELFKQYKLAFQRMLCGDPDYFVADIDCTFSLHPYMNGKPFPPQLSQKTIDAAMETNPFRARREYFNIFDHDGGELAFVKRSTINKYSQAYFPDFENKDGKSKYIIAYDPASKLDNSIILIGELFRDEEKGLMVKLVNCINLIEILKNGEKRIIQMPEQIKILRELVLSYNKGAPQFENIQRLKIDSGAGGGGFQISQFLLKDEMSSSGSLMRGMIDIEDQYMNLRQDDFPGADDRVLRMVNFKKDKTNIYEATQNMVNQGLIIFPEDMNARMEIPLVEKNQSGENIIRWEKTDYEEMNSLLQLSLLKEEIVGIEKVKKPSGQIVFEQSTEAKSQGKHDDRVDCLAMIASELAQLRAEEALKQADKPQTEYKEILAKMRNSAKKTNNPFGRLKSNPFLNNPGPSFLNK